MFSGLQQQKVASVVAIVSEMAKSFVSIIMSLPHKIIVYIDFWHQIFDFLISVFGLLDTPIFSKIQ